MTEPLSPLELRRVLAEKLATLPDEVDHNGRSSLDRQLDADRAARFAEVEAPVAEAPPAQTGPRSNPLQGHSGATVATPAPTDPLEAVRLQLRKHTL